MEPRTEPRIDVHLLTLNEPAEWREACIGSRAFCQSTLVRKLNAEDYAGVCAELLRWRFIQGKDCALPANARLCGGLATRRQSEYRQCIGEAP